MENILERVHNTGDRCLPTDQWERVYAPSIVEGNGERYICYWPWDVTRPEPPGEPEQRFCSPLGSITTLQAVLASRSGKHRIQVQETYSGGQYAKAACVDGGTVFATRKGRTWSRMVNLPIRAPLRNADRAAPLEGDLGAILRAGCQGADYER